MSSFDQDNVTTRRPARCNSENDITGLEFDNTSNSTMLFEQTLESLPNMSSVENANIIELKQKNDELIVKLESAHTEIENLLSENFQLKSELKNCQMLVKTLKQLTATDNCEPRSNNSTPRRKTSTKAVKFKPLQDILSPLLNNLRQNSMTEDTVNASISNSMTGEKNDNDKKRIEEINVTTQYDRSNISSNTDVQTSVSTDKIDNTNHNTSQHLHMEIKPTSSNQHLKPIGNDEKYINGENLLTNINKEASIVNNKTTRKKIIIIGDQYGKHIREILGNLLGPEYEVNCFLKPGGESSEILKVWKDKISSLNFSDCVVVITGSNDRNPFNFKSNIMNWAATCQNTNVIISEVPRNDYLNLVKLNYELKFICSKYRQIVYLDMGYSRFIPRKQHFALNLSRSLLKEILCIGYKQNYQNYIRYKNNVVCSLSKDIFKCDKGSQTEVTNNDGMNAQKILRNDIASQTDFANLNIDVEQLVETNDLDNSQKFFREQ